MCPPLFAVPHGEHAAYADLDDPRIAPCAHLPRRTIYLLVA